MLQGKIDVDRGVSMRQVVKFDPKNPHKFEPDIRYGGLTIYMYKDDPGVYYDTHGKKVPEGMAAAAGFDIAKNAKLRRRKDAMQQFSDRLAEELAIEDGEEVVLAEAGDWKVIGLPMDRAKIVDKETGDMVTAVPMPRADALALLDNLVGTSDDVAKINKAHDAQAKKGTANGS